MKIIPLTLAALALAAATAGAGPTLSLSWTDCSNPAPNRNLADGSTATVLATATGFTGAVQGIEIKVRVRNPNYANLPLAWRFDDAGCQAGKFQSPSQAGGPGCPLVATPTNSVASFQLDGLGGVATYSQIFSPVTPSPAGNFTVAKFDFDFSNASCICADQSQCLTVISALWIDQNGVAQNFTLGRESLTWQDPTGFEICNAGSCAGTCTLPQNPCAEAPTPVREGSWGGIKASYR